MSVGCSFSLSCHNIWEKKTERGKISFGSWCWIFVHAHLDLFSLSPCTVRKNIMVVEEYHGSPHGGQEAKRTKQEAARDKICC